MTTLRLPKSHHFAYKVFIKQPWDAPPAPPTTAPKPQRKDFPTNWDFARALLKWKNESGS